MSSDFNYNFCFRVEEWFSSLGIHQNLDVSEFALKHKHMEKNLRSIRGRQATVNALIGNKHYPTIRCLWTHSGWVQKLSEDLDPHKRESKSLTDWLTYIDDSISGYASEEATKKNIILQVHFYKLYHKHICAKYILLTRFAQKDNRPIFCQYSPWAVQATCIIKGLNCKKKCHNQWLEWQANFKGAHDLCLRTDFMFTHGWCFQNKRTGSKENNFQALPFGKALYYDILALGKSKSYSAAVCNLHFWKHFPRKLHLSVTDRVC